ncbi:hypothetical protein [Microbacterium sp. BF1]|uniref:restriction endonuclease subunit S n=1 Tax=Microbacterium sp. BF1 TaxID=2821146 RepID=UPI001C4E1B7F|nr:hypothetical protein [Microbacterium sp. BF1]
MLSVTIGRGVIPQADLLSSTSKKDSSNVDKSKYKLVEPGDIVYNKMRAWQGAAGGSKYRGIVSPAYIVMSPRDALTEYMHHVVRTPQFAKEAERWSYGITSDQWSLRPEHFKMIRFPVPPADEQTAIVKYLAHANARIDKAIAAKRRLLILIREEAQQLATDLVTGGLGHRVVESGVDLPEGWMVLPFLRAVTERADYRGATPEKTEFGVTLVTAKNVRPGWIDYESSKEYVSEADYPQIMRRGLPRAGDLLLTMEAPLGNVALVDREDVAFAQRVVRFRLDGKVLRPRFASVAMNSPYFQYQLTVRGTGSTATGIKASKLPQLLIALPPADEQDRLLGIFDQKIGTSTAIVTRVRREIDLLQEFRTRLVADVVTGQVDVRAIAATLPDAPESFDNNTVSATDDALDEALSEGEE